MGNLPCCQSGAKKNTEERSKLVKEIDEDESQIQAEEIVKASMEKKR
mgnify:CR=1 FL=1